MTSNNPLQHLTNQGLTIDIKNNKLNIKPTHLTTKEIADYIKQHKQTIKQQWLTSKETPAILKQLTSQQLDWLYDIADYLQVEPEFLLQHQFIDKYDLVEQLHNEPKLIADSILTSSKFLSITS